MCDKQNKICVLSYQAVHRKTIDTLCLLKLSGFTNVCVYAQPFHYKKVFQPIYTHRPDTEYMDEVKKIGYMKTVENLGYSLVNISSVNEILEPEGCIFLVCGAGLLPQDFLKKYNVINAHPGYIPYERGLDALKWAVVENQPIGVSSHLLGEFVDAGKVIERRKVPIYQNDTFHAVAQRQYEMEIDILVSSLDKWEKPSFITEGEPYPIHRRMPKEQEKMLLACFEEYKSLWCDKA